MANTLSFLQQTRQIHNIHLFRTSLSLGLAVTEDELLKQCLHFYCYFYIEIQKIGAS